MKKVFLTAVAVVALGSMNLKAEPLKTETVASEFRDCNDVYLDSYIYSLEVLGSSINQANMYAAVAFMGCTGNFF